MILVCVFFLMKHLSGDSVDVTRSSSKKDIQSQLTQSTMYPDTAPGTDGPSSQAQITASAVAIGLGGIILRSFLVVWRRRRRRVHNDREDVSRENTSDSELRDEHSPELDSYGSDDFILDIDSLMVYQHSAE
jgi:hypothetical protein